MLKRIIVALLFIALVVGFVTSFTGSFAQKAPNNNVCQNCEYKGKIQKCNDEPAFTEGTTSGNCVTVSSYSVMKPDGTTAYCTETKFYQCEAVAAEEAAGCPMAPAGC